jgi:NAD(P)-dependent dehydrogenase (short-subunit alcohol dehydrogenase family)
MNPVALITGASRGIGRGIAIEMGKMGYDLVINYAQNEAAARESVALCVKTAAVLGKSVRASTCRADISLATDRAALIEFTRSEFGRIDLLVNNAGVAPAVRTDILDSDEESFDRVIGVNVKGPYFLTQLAARWMIEQSRHSNPVASLLKTKGEKKVGLECSSPKIVIISSISAYTASINRGDYCIAKAAVSMLTPLYAARLAEHGISVYEIRPGLIATDMTGPVKDKYDQLIATGLTPIPRWGTPEDVGKAVAAIAQDLLPFSTGEVINVDGGFHVRRL